MLFRELTIAAKDRAITEYLASWEGIDIGFDEATVHALLWDSEDEYTTDGRYVMEEEVI